jgi:enoyl-CoA hydratase/carnithine racemase
VALNRPAVRNAFDHAMYEDRHDAR